MAIKTLRYFTLHLLKSRSILDPTRKFVKKYHEYKFDTEQIVVILTGYSWVFNKKYGRGKNAEFFWTYADDIRQYEELGKFGSFEDGEREEKRLQCVKYLDDTAEVDWDFEKDVEHKYCWED